MNKFLEKLLAQLESYRKNSGLTYFDRYSLETTVGKRYIKVCRVEIGAKGERSGNHLICFVENTTGDIFKPASWAAPAKIARGNVNSPENGMEAITPDGFVRYLRG